jgi:hypothetical protein
MYGFVTISLQLIHVAESIGGYILENGLLTALFGV